MLNQTIPDVAPSNGASAPSKTGDSFVDSALEALESFGDGGTPTSSRRERTRPKPDAPEGDEGTEDVPDPLAAEPDNDNGEPQDAGVEEGDEAHDTRGSREDPFSVKDLPKDRYIELKVDGEKTVVSLDEMAAGYIREQTFSARINKAKQLTDEAEALAKKAHDVQTRVAQEFREFVGDPDQIYEFFTRTEEREQVFEAAAMRYAALLKRFRENPHERLAYERQRDQERLNAEREHWEAQKRAEHAEKTRKEQTERALAVFKPGWNEGLRKAGFPEPSQALWDEVMLRCDQRVKSGAQVTSEDVAEFVVRAAKLLELPPASQKRPKPASMQAAPPPKRTRGKDRWADMSPSERRKDPEYFLRNLRPQDLR